MGLLCWAWLLVALAPLKCWRDSLGFAAAGEKSEPEAARLLAAQVGRAASRLPFHSKCLPRAMATSWVLRRKRIAHSVVIAARPPGGDPGEDALHAWLEADGVVLVGELPGPWREILRLGG
jgi:hypothetical protein